MFFSFLGHFLKSVKQKPQLDIRRKGGLLTIAKDCSSVCTGWYSNWRNDEEGLSSFRFVKMNLKQGEEENKRIF